MLAFTLVHVKFERMSIGTVECLINVKDRLHVVFAVGVVGISQALVVPRLSGVGAASATIGMPRSCASSSF